MQTSVHETRSNLEGCSHLGKHPSCPCRQAVTTRNDDCIGVSVMHANWQFSTGCHLMRLPHLSKESWYPVGEGPAFLFSTPLLLWLSEAELGFLKSQHLDQLGEEREAGRIGFSEIRPFLIFLPVIFTAHSNKPRKSLFVLESEPWCHSVEGRERRNLMQFFRGVLNITIITWVSKTHSVRETTVDVCSWPISFHRENI